MPFDFYLNKYNICIEVQGEQHYKPVGFGNIKFKKSIENFILQRKRDKIKENYCKENNIGLLKISYIDIQNGNYKNIISLGTEHILRLQNKYFYYLDSFFLSTLAKGF